MYIVVRQLAMYIVVRQLAMYIVVRQLAMYIVVGSHLVLCCKNIKYIHNLLLYIYIYIALTHVVHMYCNVLLSCCGVTRQYTIHRSDGDLHVL